MKTIGLIGGMSWESTVSYYTAINREVQKQLGGLHSAQILLHSIDFAPLEQLIREHNWSQAARLLIEVAKNLEQAGADCVLICTNTMHKVAPEVAAQISCPLIHIADATAECIIQQNFRSVGLLGTAYTMEDDFYTGRLTNTYGLQVLVPEQNERAQVHNIIFQELCHGIHTTASKEAYLSIIEQLRLQGAEAVILGCTEIGMLISQQDTPLPLLDTTLIHAQKAVDFALAK